MKDKRIQRINGANVELVQIGSKKPLVIFESGLDGHLEWWAKVLNEVSKSHSVFAYNRPGIGGSTKTSKSRDAAQIVEDLRETLRALGLAPPYVLVGHSAGGLYLQLFARKYSSEVAGLILVDSTHPEQMHGSGAKENWPWLTKVYFDLFVSENGKRELAEINKSGQQVLMTQLENFKFPIILLTATDPSEGGSDYLKDLIEKRKKLVELYPNARQIFVDSDHAIPLNKPEVIVEAINEIIAKSPNRDN